MIAVRGGGLLTGKSLLWGIVRRLRHTNGAVLVLSQIKLK
jgi:hypothetical protein